MKNIDEQIAKTQAQINQLTNKKKRLISEQKQAERKKRTKRLIERGAILESVIGNAAELWRSKWAEIYTNSIILCRAIKPICSA